MEVDQSTALVAAIAAGIPSGIVTVVGFLLRNAFTDFKEALKEANSALGEIKDAMSEHRTDIAVLKDRLERLETGRLVTLEVELGNLRQRQHDQGNALLAMSARERAAK